MNPAASNEQPAPSKPSRWRPGPGLLVTAAFIGPGTVVTASKAGARFGLDLLWVTLLAVAATAVLQEMAARLGLVARLGLAGAIRETLRPAWARRAALGLVLTAIVLGNTAYQTGNLTGAGVGLAAVSGAPAGSAALVVGLAVAVMLAVGASSRWLHAGLVVVVLVMSAAFLVTGALVGTDLRAAAAGAAGFSLPEGSLLTALALFGTTVVPYNLFLHATAVQERWPEGDTGRALRSARIDTVAAIGVGGLVTMAIVATAAAAFHDQQAVPQGAAALAEQLRPLLGGLSELLFAAGLAAAGLTSAVTAPLAAGYAAAGALGRDSPRVAKATAVGVALVGTGLAWWFGQSPQATIVVAQAANGLLLPLVALFLLAVMNQRELLGERRNGWAANLAGVGVVLAALTLGGMSLFALFGRS